MLCPAETVAIASTERTGRASVDLVAGGLPGLVAALDAIHAVGETAVLAIVVATEGSTYQKPGALILLDRSGVQHGVISGGCLEPEIEALATDVLIGSHARWVDFDTRSDEDLTFGSGTGCRGRVRLVLLPQPPQAPLSRALVAVAKSGRVLDIVLNIAGGNVGSGCASLVVTGEESARHEWRWGVDGIASSPIAANFVEDAGSVRITVARPQSVLLLGAGPETPVLLSIARHFGWIARVAEHRQRWRKFAADVSPEYIVELAPQAAAEGWRREHFDAILLMSHNYHLDLQALRLCAQLDVGYIGLLGPAARRDALLADLDAADVEHLRPRLHAPVGLALGGSGPAPIALAIAAELQQYFARAPHSPQRRQNV